MWCACVGVARRDCKSGEKVNMTKLLVGLCLLLGASFPACRADGTLDFLILGDWGGQDTSPYYTTAEKEIAEQMGKTAEQVGSQFTLALGDNFYSFGVKNVDDPRFEETFEVSYTTNIM